MAGGCVDCRPSEKLAIPTDARAVRDREAFCAVTEKSSDSDTVSFLTKWPHKSSDSDRHGISDLRMPICRGDAAGLHTGLWACRHMAKP
jgi:hypothetical protein